MIDEKDLVRLRFRNNFGRERVSIKVVCLKELRIEGMEGKLVWLEFWRVEWGVDEVG